MDQEYGQRPAFSLSNWVICRRAARHRANCRAQRDNGHVARTVCRVGPARSPLGSFQAQRQSVAGKLSEWTRNILARQSTVSRNATSPPALPLRYAEGDVYLRSPERCARSLLSVRRVEVFEQLTLFIGGQVVDDEFLCASLLDTLRAACAWQNLSRSVHQGLVINGQRLRKCMQHVWRRLRDLAAL